MIRACPGIICTIRSMTSTDARNLNRNLATATDASRETTEATRTVASVTARLLRKNSHTEPIPDAWPLITSREVAERGMGRGQVRESARRSPATA